VSSLAPRKIDESSTRGSRGHPVVDSSMSHVARRTGGEGEGRGRGPAERGRRGWRVVQTSFREAINRDGGIHAAYEPSLWRLPCALSLPLSLSLCRCGIHRKETRDLFIRIGPPSRPFSLSPSTKTRAIPVQQFLRPPPFIAGAKNDGRVYCRPTVFSRCNCASPSSPARILSFSLPLISA